VIILCIEILIIAILAIIFSTVVVDEKRNRQRGMRSVKLKGYWDGDDRRSVNRLNVSLQVKYFANGTALATQSADISVRGIRLLLDEKIEKGIPLRMEIKLPDDDCLIKASGEVVWTEESREDEKKSVKRLFNTGIKFSGFQGSGGRKLLDFIQTLRSKKS